MHTFQKIIPILILSTLFACSPTERKGLPENERAYVNEITNDLCTNAFEYVSDDLILELNTISIDDIAQKATQQLDSVYGSKGITNFFKDRLKSELTKNYFSLKDEIKDNLLVIGSNNLWDIENSRAFFDSNKIHPRKLDWKKTILCGEFEPTILHRMFDRWTIEQKIVPCIKSNWKETGQFKKITDSKDELKILPSYQYQLEVEINIHLLITHSETSKQEQYITTLSDVCKGYSSANFIDWYRLNGKTPPSQTDNEHKKLKVTSSLKKFGS